MRLSGSGVLPRTRSGVARLIVWACLAAFVAVAGCDRAPRPDAAPPPPEVLVATVLQKDAAILVEWIGTTEGFVNAEIRPRVPGYILTQRYTEGVSVTKGQVLFEIDARQAQASLDQAKGRLASARVALAKAQQDVARYRPLAVQKAVSQQELDTVVAAQDNARADVDSAQAALDQTELTLQWTKVTSPIDGVAGIATAQVGALVSEQTVMTTVSALDPIKVSFNITEEEYLRFWKLMSDTGGKLEDATLELLLGDGSLYPHKGRAIFADRQMDARTGTITIKGSFPNPGSLLRPGQYARIRTIGNMKHGALLVPQRAITELQGVFLVGVVGADNKVELRVVKPAERLGSLWIVGEGLHPGDRIVVEGTQRIRSGMTVVPKPAPPITDTAAGLAPAGN